MLCGFFLRLALAISAAQCLRRKAADHASRQRRSRRRGLVSGACGGGAGVVLPLLPCFFFLFDCFAEFGFLLGFFPGSLFFLRFVSSFCFLFCRRRAFFKLPTQTCVKNGPSIPAAAWSVALSSVCSGGGGFSISEKRKAKRS